MAPRIILKTILTTFILTIVISSIGLFIFFNEEIINSEGKQSVTLFSILNVGLAIIQSTFCLLSLFISKRQIAADKFLTAIIYFLPLIPCLTISMWLILNADKFSFDKFMMVPLFSFLPFAIIWTILYFIRIRRQFTS